MKKIIFLILFLIALINAFTQQMNPAPALTKQDYLKKSKNQRTAAIFIAGWGGVMGMTGILLAIAGTAEEIGDLFTGETSNKDNTGAGLMVAGLVSLAGSVPLFIASGNNRKRALSVSLKSEFIPQLQKKVLFTIQFHHLN